MPWILAQDKKKKEEKRKIEKPVVGKWRAEKGYNPRIRPSDF